MTDDGKNPMRIVSDIAEFAKIQEFMEDENVDRALIKLTKILSNRDIPGIQIAKQIVDCQALSAYFGIQARYYMGIGKAEPDHANKKNIYMTLKDSFNELAQALKYIERAGS